MARLDLVVDAVVKGKNNLSGLATDLDAADKKAGTLKTTLTKGLAFGGGFVAALGLKEGVEFLADAVVKAGEFQDTVSATSQILGQDATPALEKWADEAATSFGASKQVALEAVNTFATFGKSAGLAGEDLAGFSTDLSQLAGDLASFRGGTTEDAITAIGAALRGESEPIRRYGVLLDDATLRQKALELGIVRTTKQALTPQQRVLAAQAEIFEQTADAQGDFARTQDGFKNTTQSLQAELENLSIELGEKLLPVMTDVARFLRDNLFPAFEALGKGLDFAANFANIFNPLGGLLKTQDENLKRHQEEEAKRLKAGEDAWESYTTSIATAADDVKDRVRELTASEISAIEEHWVDIRAAGSETVKQYNIGIFEAQNSLQTEIDALLEVLKNRLSPAEEIARLQGQQMTLALAREAADSADDGPAVAAIDEMIAKINAQINALGGFARQTGANIVSEIVAGMRQQAALSQTKGDIYAIGGIIRDGVGIESEPKDPNSPLRGITKWGGNIVQTITDGMMRQMGLAQQASMALASTLAVAPMSPLASGIGIGVDDQLPAGVNVNLTVQGDLRADERTLPSILQRSIFASGVLEG